MLLMKTIVRVNKAEYFPDKNKALLSSEKFIKIDFFMDRLSYRVFQKKWNMLLSLHVIILETLINLCLETCDCQINWIKTP